ncbi:wax ester synthase/diacylglycerol acyltransferase 4-like [Tasmannia lanceolata]|uniref:wax ester synthase/diacylglycerol acyltransferase 4-like n=1 Tax=Tasmannia lanceolata TaxID=3420 RepID=UPI0040634E20
MVLKVERSMEEEEGVEPVSPTGQYFNSSALSVSILGVFESEIPIEDSLTMVLLRDVFLLINPRFSSIMVKDENGVPQWRRVKVKLEDHVKTPIFPDGLSPESYDEYLDEYLSKIALEQLPQSRPLWDVHIIKYPSSNAAGTLVIKLHHAMGDGFSLMGAIFSCVKRADDPSLPLTFPPQMKVPHDKGELNIFRSVPRFLSVISNTVYDFVWSLMKSSVVEDDKTTIRSAVDGVEFLPMTISTVSFSLDHIQQIKSKLGATVNDVVSGIVFYGIQLYVQSEGSPCHASRVTALVLLSTRMISGYQSVEEMTKPDAKSAWGNQFGFIHVAVPPCADVEKADPLGFVYYAKEVVKRKRSSLAVYLTGRLLETVRRLRGFEVTAQYMHTTLRNTSMTISNLVGPMEQMGIANHPCKGLYFMMCGVPQSLTITLISYNGTLRMALGMEKGFINPKLLTSCIERALERISEAALAKSS